MKVSNLEAVLERNTDVEFDALLEKLASTNVGYDSYNDNLITFVQDIGFVFLDAATGSDAYDDRQYGPIDMDYWNNSDDEDSYVALTLSDVKERFVDDLKQVIIDKPIERLASFKSLYDDAVKLGFKETEYKFADKLRLSKAFKELAAVIVSRYDG